MLLHLTPVPACKAAQWLCVSVDLMLEQGSNLPLKQGGGESEAYWCFSYKSTSRKPQQKCCTASRWISGGATAGREERRQDVSERGRKAEEGRREGEEMFERRGQHKNLADKKMEGDEKRGGTKVKLE